MFLSPCMFLHHRYVPTLLRCFYLYECFCNLFSCHFSVYDVVCIISQIVPLFFYRSYQILYASPEQDGRLNRKI